MYYNYGTSFDYIKENYKFKNEEDNLDPDIPFISNPV